MSWEPRRKFWSEVSVEPREAGFTVLLDGKGLHTPAKAPLTVPTAALAEAIAAEWRALGEEIDPERLPLTKSANSAIDRVSRNREAVIDAIAAYGDSDLLCYRAEEPEGLLAREAAAWQPWLDWAAEVLHAPLDPVEGVMHRRQAPASLAALRSEVARLSPLGLAALYDLVTLSGSLVLGLAVARDAIAALDAWEISRLDETWQAEQWGVDHEAALLAESRKAAFLRAEALLALLGDAKLFAGAN